MSEQIREQVSAFLDGELPSPESELLLKRLTRDTELRGSFGRYALIGESLRGAAGAHLTRSFATRVNGAVNAEPALLQAPPVRARTPRWWRPIAGAALAAGVATVAVVALQQRAVAPTLREAVPMTAQNMTSAQAGSGAQSGSGAQPQEALSYTVPAMGAAAPTALPAARLTNYVFAHSKYSSPLGQSNVLSGLLSDADEQEAAANAAAMDQPPQADVRPRP